MELDQGSISLIVKCHDYSALGATAELSIVPEVNPVNQTDIVL